MGITSMNLGIIRTLLNHINRLEDRIDELDGRLSADARPIGLRAPEASSASEFSRD